MVRNSARLVNRCSLALLALMWAQPLGAQTQSIRYYYDDLGRLITVVDSSGNVATYVYDAVGNIVEIKRSTVAPGSLAIIDFNPDRGEVGTLVTMRGQGFSTTPASDLVKFNGTVATVTSASATSLIAKVPAGTTTGPISVTVGGKTVVTADSFTIPGPPVINSVFPKSALFNVVIPSFHVNGTNLLGATFSFSPAGPTVDDVSVNSSGTSATMTLSAGSTAGTFALVATDPYRHSSTVASATSRFTVVDPNSTDISASGLPDVVEAAYGADPLDPHSFPTANSPPLDGEVDDMSFSVLNTGARPATVEADGILFSVQNNAKAANAIETSNSRSTSGAPNVSPPATSPAEVSRASGSGLSAVATVTQQEAQKSIQDRKGQTNASQTESHR